jgi:threonyl-tRNA synthetase
MTPDKDLQPMRHSLAHILATALQAIWPEVRLGVGPAIENGFYYDIDIPGVMISEADFGTIEKQMKKIIGQNQKFVQSSKTTAEALQWSKDTKQIYKEELINDLMRQGTTVAKDLDSSMLGVATDNSQVDTVGFYSNGDFSDLCRGPHVESTGKVGAFKLVRIAGAYWRGKETNPQMQRLYGVAFANREDLEAYLKLQEEAKARDHRVLGPAMDIYMISDTVGSGLPLMLPRGEMLKNLLVRYMRQEEETRGYQYVETPVLAQENLYERSGHAAFYSEDMYKLTDDEGQNFYLKPMNCPHHHMIYERLVESYRDLPLKLAEVGRIYRKEKSGTLTGLIRVRGPISQNDSHIYVTPDQLKDEFIKVLELFKATYEVMGVSDYWYRLSLPDFAKDKFDGDRATWEAAGNSIRNAMKEFGAEFVEAEGEAAFYGPKVDVQTRNVTGKEDTIATSQIDILVPHRMDINYIDEQGVKQKPFIIHRAILGSYERFMGFLIEKTAGWLPFWLAPEQIRILTINDTVMEYVGKISSQLDATLLMTPLKYNELRYTVDARNESLGKKIKEATNAKIPMLIIVGPRDIEARQVSIRLKDGEQKIALSDLKSFIESFNGTRD